MPDCGCPRRCVGEERRMEGLPRGRNIGFLTDRYTLRNHPDPRRQRDRSVRGVHIRHRLRSREGTGCGYDDYITFRSRMRVDGGEGMRIVVLAGSPRRNGNTDMLVGSFVKGASVHNEVEVIRVADLNISPCIGCERCKSSDGITCSIDDDMSKVYGSLSHADMLVLASPVYCYGITAQLKTV